VLAVGCMGQGMGRHPKNNQAAARSPVGMRRTVKRGLFAAREQIETQNPVPLPSVPRASPTRTEEPQCELPQMAASNRSEGENCQVSVERLHGGAWYPDGLHMKTQGDEGATIPHQRELKSTAQYCPG